MENDKTEGEIDDDKNAAIYIILNSEPNTNVNKSYLNLTKNEERLELKGINDGNRSETDESESDYKSFTSESDKSNEISVKENDELERYKIDKSVLGSIELKIIIFIIIFWILTGLTLIAEVMLAINYLMNDDIKFSILTFIFTILPSLFIGIWGGRTFFFQMIFSYISTSFHMFKVHHPSKRLPPSTIERVSKNYLEAMKIDHTNTSAVTVLKRAIETAPQLLIQLSILLFMNVRDINQKYTTFLQSLAILLLTILLTATISLWDWSLLLHQNKRFGFKKAVIQFCAYFFIILSRMLALSLLAFVHPKCSTNALLIHIIVSAILVYSYSDPFQEKIISDQGEMKTNVDSKMKMYYSLLTSIVLTFLPITFNDKRSYVIFYSLFLIESIFVTLFSYFTVDLEIRKNVLYISFFWVNYIFFILGLLFTWLNNKNLLYEPTNRY